MADYEFAPVIDSEGYLLSKTETTYGTDPTIADSDAVRVFDVNITPSFQTVHRRYFMPYAGYAATTVGAHMVDVEFKFDLAGSGTDGSGVVVPSFDPVLQAGMLRRVDDPGGPPYTYRDYFPVTQQTNAARMEFYFLSATADSLRYEIAGVMGELTFEMNIDEGTFVIGFSGKGLYITPTDQSVGTPTWTEMDPPSLEGITFTIDGDCFVIPSFSWTNGVEIAEGKTMSSCTNVKGGYAYFLARRTFVSGSFVTDAKREGAVAGDEYPFWGNLEAGTEYVVAFSGIGAAAGNTWSGEVSKLVIDNMSTGTNGPVQTNECDWSALMTSGDDEFWLRLED